MSDLDFEIFDEFGARLRQDEIAFRVCEPWGEESGVGEDGLEVA